MRDLILIRHGQSEANTLQQASKKGDHSLYTPAVRELPDHSWRLTAAGEAQAQATGRWLQQEGPPLHRHLVSPFTRTRETAAHLGLPEASWEECREARERSWGEVASLSRRDFQALYPGNHSLRGRDPLYWAPPAGESIAGMAEGRIALLLERLRQEEEARGVLLVTHGEVTWAARLLLEQWTDEEFVERDANPAWRVHNGHLLHYTSYNPHSSQEEGDLTWVRRGWPTLQEDGSYTLTLRPWERIAPRRYSNGELLTKAHSRPRLFPR